MSSYLHNVLVEIDNDDYRKLTGHGQLVAQIEEGIRLFAATLPEPVKPPRAPSVTQLTVTFSQADFLRAKETGPIPDVLLSAVAEYAENPGNFMDEGRLTVPAWQSDTHAIKFRWKIQADLVEQILPRDGFERANFIRAALSKYVTKHCQHIVAPSPHRRRTFVLDVPIEDLERLLNLSGCSTDTHVLKALTTFLARRKRTDSMSPPEGQLNPHKPAARLICTIPESLYNGIAGNLSDLEDTTRAAIKAYLRRAKVEREAAA